MSKKRVACDCIECNGDLVCARTVTRHKANPRASKRPTQTGVSNPVCQTERQFPDDQSCSDLPENLQCSRLNSIEADAELEHSMFEGDDEEQDEGNNTISGDNVNMSESFNAEASSSKLLSLNEAGDELQANSSAVGQSTSEASKETAPVAQEQCGIAHEIVTGAQLLLSEDEPAKEGKTQLEIEADKMHRHTDGLCDNDFQIDSAAMSSWEGSEISPCEAQYDSADCKNDPVEPIAHIDDDMTTEENVQPEIGAEKVQTTPSLQSRPFV